VSFENIIKMFRRIAKQEGSRVTVSSAEIGVLLDKLDSLLREKQNGAMTVEAILIELESIGNPRLAKMEGGWYASLKLIIAADGANFEIATEFDNATPLLAMQVLRQRVVDVLDKTQDSHKLLTI